MTKLYEAMPKKFAFKAKSKAEYASWKRRFRATLREITGIDRMVPSAAFSANFGPREDRGDYYRYHLRLRTEKGAPWMTLYQLTPKKIDPSMPVIIACHGHASAGKEATGGSEEIPCVKTAIETYNYRYGVEMAKRGHVVFCPDARGFGERREAPMQGDGEDKFMHSSCLHLNRIAIPLGMSVTGMWAFDLMRLVDYIQTLKGVNTKDIRCAGLSGGGLQTLWLMALDERITRGVISGYFYGHKDSLLSISCCDCNYVPHLYEMGDMGDMAALIAPRPLLIESGTQDYLNGHRGIVNTTEQVAIARKAYRLLGKRNALVHDIFEDEHRFHGTPAYDFLSAQA
ncbi:MAG: hypothetical protein FWF84_05545 [Kiritimatiellaeota bacterium]|nr:hypothetical protein [Kiritimatiellota bacterium]